MSRFLRELNQGTVVAHLIQRYVRTMPDGVKFNFHFETGKDSDDAMHPSSAWVCSRELYARRKGDFKPSYSPDSAMTFLVGHFYHALVQHVLVDHMKIAKQEDIEKEVRFESASWWGRGFIDVAHCNTDDGDYLIDLKTVNGVMFKAPNLPPDLWNKYYAQVQLYLDWEGMENAILLCFEKDSPHRLKEYKIEADPEFVETIYERWDRVANGLRHSEPPDCDCESLAKKASNCAVKDLYAMRRA